MDDLSGLILYFFLIIASSEQTVQC